MFIAVDDSLPIPRNVFGHERSRCPLPPRRWSFISATGRDCSLPVLFDSTREAAAVAAGGRHAARTRGGCAARRNVLSARGSGARTLPAEPRLEAQDVARLSRVRAAGAERMGRSWVENEIPPLIW